MSLFFSKKFSRVNIKIILFLLAHFNIFFTNYLFLKVCSTFFTCVWLFIYFLSFMNVQKITLRVSKFPYTLLMIACTNHITLWHFCYNFLISHVYHIFLFYGLFLMQLLDATLTNPYQTLVKLFSCWFKVSLLITEKTCLIVAVSVDNHEFCVNFCGSSVDHVTASSNGLLMPLCFSFQLRKI